MNNRRRRLLTLMGGLPACLGVPPSQILRADESIGINPPVENPGPDVERAIKLIKAALAPLSEDKPLTLDEIFLSMPELKSIQGNNVQLALRYLLWHQDVQEVENGHIAKYRLFRSAAEHHTKPT
jgi:hypothetical protein